MPGGVGDGQPEIPFRDLDVIVEVSSNDLGGDGPPVDVVLREFRVGLREERNLDLAGLQENVEEGLLPELQVDDVTNGVQGVGGAGFVDPSLEREGDAVLVLLSDQNRRITSPGSNGRKRTITGAAPL